MIPYFFKSSCIRIFLLFFIAFNSTYAQSKIGFEFRTSQNMTFNDSEIRGGLYYELSDERNPVTLSYSLGLIYDLGSFSVFKLHLGRHQNGRIIDGSYDYGHHSDSGDFQGIDSPNKFLQIVLSYAFNYSFGKSRFPLELGFATNKLSNIGDLRFIGIDNYNFDVRLSLGYEYELVKNGFIGINGVYSNALTNYSDEYYTYGEFDPSQLGIEISLKYYIKEFNKKEEQNDLEESSL